MFAVLSVCTVKGEKRQNGGGGCWGRSREKQILWHLVVVHSSKTLGNKRIHLKIKIKSSKTNTVFPNSLCRQQSQQRNIELLPTPFKSIYFGKQKASLCGQPSTHAATTLAGILYEWTKATLCRPTSSKRKESLYVMGLPGQWRQRKHYLLEFCCYILWMSAFPLFKWAHHTSQGHLCFRVQSNDILLEEAIHPFLHIPRRQKAPSTPQHYTTMEIPLLF